MRVLALALLLCLPLTACRTTDARRDAAPSEGEPAILGSLQSGGRGLPNGTTDLRRAMPLGPVSTDSTYGHTAENPVKVGQSEEGPRNLNQIRFMSALAGPSGEPITYERAGHCCPYPTPNGFGGTGVLDVYRITYDGLDVPLLLYVTLYDYEAPRVPTGFTAAR